MATDPPGPEAARIESFHLRLGGGRRCEVRLGVGAVDALPQIWRADWREAALIGDTHVIQQHGEALVRRLQPLVCRLEVLDFPPGETNKTRASKEQLEDSLLCRGLGREICIVALGGGITLDLAGFVAATYLRGVAHLNVPTSLLAQVDAAIGGKTGVNTPRGKNLVGAFHQPRAVLVDPALLATLPAEEWGNGLAEMVKHAVVADREFFGWLEEHVPDLRTPGVIAPHPLRRCLEIKTAIVEEDEQEAGRRAVLNFGHTLGHAVERALDHQVSHGRAVSIGMALEARLAVVRCALPQGEADRLRRLLLDLGLPVELPRLPFAALLPFLDQDKKRRQGELRLALPTRLGEMAGASEGYTLAVPLDLVRQTWEHA